MSPRTKGILFAELNALLGGVMFVTGHQVTDYMEPVRFAALMYLVIAPFNTIWWWLTHIGVVRPFHAAEHAHHNTPFNARAVLWLIVHSLCSVGGIVLLWMGMARMESAVGSMLSRLEVLVAIAIGILFLRERLTRRHWLGFALTIAGLLLLRWTVLSGEALGFVYLVCGATFFGMAEASGKLAVKYTPVPRLMLLRAWLMLLCLAGLWWLMAPGWPQVPLAIWGWLVLSALLGPLLSRNCYMLALSYLPVSSVVLLTQAQPVYAALAGVLIRSEFPALTAYAGGTLIILGNVLLILARDRSPDPARGT